MSLQKYLLCKLGLGFVHMVALADSPVTMYLDYISMKFLITNQLFLLIYLFG